MNINFGKTLVESLGDNIFEINEMKMSNKNICYLIIGGKVKRIFRKD